MAEIILDGRRLAERSEMHDELSEKLSLPEHYGRNLDALNDCLSELVEKPVIRIEHAEALYETLGLIRVLRENGIEIHFE